jgi:hypothetical protein
MIQAERVRRSPGARGLSDEHPHTAELVIGRVTSHEYDAQNSAPTRAGVKVLVGPWAGEAG